jgi:hypothetical protein
MDELDRLIAVYPQDEDLLVAHAVFPRRIRREHTAVDPFAVDDATFVTLYYFSKDHIRELACELHLPLVFRTGGRGTVIGTWALIYLLHRYRSNSTYRAAAVHFGIPYGQLCSAVKMVERLIYQRFGRLLSKFHPVLVNRRRLKYYARKVRHYGNPIPNIWGFIDGTKFPICRPGGPTFLQAANYSGHPGYHCLSYQAVISADGMFAHVYGGVEGRLNDLNLLEDSKIEPTMLARPGTCMWTALF